MTFAFGYLSDKTSIRGPLVITAISVFWLFWIAFQQKSLAPDRWLKYGLLIMVQGFNAAYHVSVIHLFVETRRTLLMKQFASP